MPSSRTVIDILRSAYSLEKDDCSWLDTITTSVQNDLNKGLGVYSYIYDASDINRFKFDPIRFQNCNNEVQNLALTLLQYMTPELIENLFFAQTVGTSSEALGKDKVLGILGSLTKTVQDNIAINAINPSGRGCVLMAPSPAILTLTSTVRKKWELIAAHLSSAHRLRETLIHLNNPMNDAEAVFDADSLKLLHANGPAALQPHRHELKNAVTRLVEAEKQNTPAEKALELWPALVAGRWSIVHRQDNDQSRYYIAWRNAPLLQNYRKLTPKEDLVVRQAALGHSNRSISYSLGMKLSTVATHLTAAQTKLGIQSRSELIWLYYSSKGKQVQNQDDMAFAEIDLWKSKAKYKLTQAEQEIVVRVARGESDQQIADARNTSPRTVANQLRTLFARMNVRSRPEFIAKLAKSKSENDEDPNEDTSTPPPTDNNNDCMLPKVS